MNPPADRILVVEDEPQIRRFVCDALRRKGCVALEAGTGRAGLDIAGSGQPDLIILDLGLPDMNGLEFIGNLRAWSKVPILILSARATEQDKIAALDAGADDYLTKPFGVGELLARLRALLRRRTGDDASPVRRFGNGNIEVDLSLRRVRRAGEDIHLTRIEYRLLAVLLANEGKVLTHRQLMRDVWGPGHAEQGHYLRIYIARLRQKLEDDPTRPTFLLTETGIGYRFQS